MYYFVNFTYKDEIMEADPDVTLLPCEWVVKADSKEEAIEQIKKDIECIGKLDFIFAKAKYSRAIKGITPLINDNKEIKLINAKHPLLDQNTAVPISLELGTSFNTLIITSSIIIFSSFTPVNHPQAKACWAS